MIMNKQNNFIKQILNYVERFLRQKALNSFYLLKLFFSYCWFSQEFNIVSNSFLKKKLVECLVKIKADFICNIVSVSQY